MRQFIFIIVFFFFCPDLIGQNTRDSIFFSLRFSKCFDNDIISIKINNVFISSLIVIDSDKSGETGFEYLQDQDHLYEIYKNEKRILPKLTEKQNITIEIFLNGTSNKFLINLKKGKYIILNRCTANKPTSEYKLYISQSLKK